MILYVFFLLFFFFNDTATTEIYTLSLHDALPISMYRSERVKSPPSTFASRLCTMVHKDRKSTRLNSSHLVISYAVFCLKKKKKKKENEHDIVYINTRSESLHQCSETLAHHVMTAT